MKAYYLSAAAVILALAGCSKTPSTTTTDADAQQSEATQQVTYTGTLPAADCEGINYTLTLNYTDQGKGTYSLEQVYISDLNPATFTESGDFEQLTGTPADSTARYFRLVNAPKVGDAKSDTTYYVVTSDSTLVLTGAYLDMPAAPADYTLKVKH